MSLKYKFPNFEILNEKLSHSNDMNYFKEKGIIDAIANLIIVYSKENNNIFSEEMIKNIISLTLINNEGIFEGYNKIQKMVLQMALETAVFDCASIA